MHSEMFPLLDDSQPNVLELFQIWLNLPPQSKMVPAYFGMLWSEEIPTITPAPGVLIDLIAGGHNDEVPPSPPPDSWASDGASDLVIWLIRLDPGASWDLPATSDGVNRMLHLFMGDDVGVDDTRIQSKTGVRLDPSHNVALVNHGGPAEFLLLQGQPIGAPVFQMVRLS